MIYGHDFKYRIPEMDLLLKSATDAGILFPHSTENVKKDGAFVAQVLILQTGDTSVTVSVTKNRPEKRIAYERIGKGGKIIVFPSPVKTDASLPPDEEGDYPPFPEWLDNFKGSGFEDYSSVGRKILHALHSLRISSLKELANTPPGKIRNRHSVGDKSLEIIRSVLERNGLSWDIIKGA